MRRAARSVGALTQHRSPYESPSHFHRNKFTEETSFTILVNAIRCDCVTV